MIRRCSRDFCHFLAENTKNCIRHRKTKNQDFCILSYEIDHEQFIFAKKVMIPRCSRDFCQFSTKKYEKFIFETKSPKIKILGSYLILPTMSDSDLTKNYDSVVFKRFFNNIRRKYFLLKIIIF